MISRPQKYETMAKADGFYKKLVELVDRHGSVNDYRKLWSEHFDNEPTQEHINKFNESIREKHEEDYNEDDDSYSDTYSD